uniref:esterase-like activity of phytase family protein n=2 Tax=Picosynechococcus sp. PCC 8807 TaxID=195248 RepID=UPI001E3E7C1D|nr:esterase-like activity of phytase family protein [Picosynechococcus sp. PCC 8807]
MGKPKAVMKPKNTWWRSPKILWIKFCLIGSLLIGCAPVVPPAESNPRTFAPLSVEFLDEYWLPKTEFQGTTVGGLSALYYDAQTGDYYALSDDRSQFAPARFYTFDLDIDETGAIPQIQQLNLQTMTPLTTPDGETFAPGSLDPEGLVLSPRNTLFISSEGDTDAAIDPFVKEFDREGRELTSLRIPQRFLTGDRQRGVRNNLGFESLAISAPSQAAVDPFRIFVAPESSLHQDTRSDNVGAPIRLLHYVINPIGEPVLIAEHLYPLEPAPQGTFSNGLVEMIALPQEGYFLSLERSYGLGGVSAKLFQVTIGNATDTARIESLAGNPETVVPMQKTLLLDLRQLGIGLDNLEGMTLGPQLADGSQSLLLISDDNFSTDQVNQLLLFRLSNSAAKVTSK